MNVKFSLPSLATFQVGDNSRNDSIKCRASSTERPPTLVGPLRQRTAAILPSFVKYDYENHSLAISSRIIEPNEGELAHHHPQQCIVVGQVSTRCAATTVLALF